MKRNFVIVSLVIMAVLFIGGLVTLFNSTDTGRETGYKEMQKLGGMIGEQYNFIISSTTENYRIGGMVIALVGGFGMLVSGYGLYKEL
jgi:hypothetical protein